MTSDGDWSVIVSRRATNVMSRLPAPDRRRVELAIDSLSQGPGMPARKLAGRPDWAVRVGGRRILFRVDWSIRTIIVAQIGPRGDVYKE